jgi:hypothetical protein
MIDEIGLLLFKIILWKLENYTCFEPWSSHDWALAK